MYICFIRKSYSNESFKLYKSWFIIHEICEVINAVDRKTFSNKLINPFLFKNNKMN